MKYFRSECGNKESGHIYDTLFTLVRCDNADAERQQVMSLKNALAYFHFETEQWRAKSKQ